jgi:TatA/E family protein of Tat protein translocase
MEIVVVLVLALLVFGPSRLPQAGRSLGQAMREFRKATQAARSELGLDEVAEGVKDLKSSMNVDLGLNDIKSSMTVDLNAATAGAAVVAPPADKPVPVAAAGSDTTPPEAPASEAGGEPAAEEPAVAESPAAETAGDDTTPSGASGAGDDA